VTPDRFKLIVLRGEGNLDLEVSCSHRDSGRLAEWLAKGSGYMVIRDNALPGMKYPNDSVSPTGNWISL
jgi:hypothetical protein